MCCASCVCGAANPDKVRIPLELVSIAPFQPVGENTTEIQQACIKETAKKPHERLQAIQQCAAPRTSSRAHRHMPAVSRAVSRAAGTCLFGARRIVDDVQNRPNENKAAAFQISLQRGLVSAPAKQLNPAKIVYRNRPGGDEVECPVDMGRGQWNLSQGGRDLAFIKPGNASSYGVVVFEQAAQSQQVAP